MGAFFFWKKPEVKGRVSILIPTFKDSRYIIELCLKSIKKHTDYPDYQIIVCEVEVNEETHEFLEEQKRQGTIRLIKASGTQMPKDDLADAVDTPYYIIMHDDIKIRRDSWLKRRMELLLSDERNAVVGSVVENFGKGTKRFFPLALLVRTDAAKKMGLRWGKVLEKGLDTGAVAYQTFFAQNEYRFVPYKPSRDIYHFSAMSWPKRKDPGNPFVAKALKAREQKIQMIRQMLEKGDY